MFMKLRSSDKWESLSGKELWNRFKENDRKAFSTLFLRYYSRLFKYGMNFTSSEEVAKDAIQKLFVRLWDKRDLIDTPDSIDGYLFVSIRRILLRKNKRDTSRSRRNARYLKGNDREIESIEQEIILEEKRQKRSELYEHAIKSLSPRQKEALILRVNNGMNNSEIANIMEISDKRVRNLMYEATKRLKEEIYNLTE